MDWYLLSVVLHLLAAFFWLGHMFFWSLVVGPITKRFDPPDAGRWLRQTSMRYGGLGWPALIILIGTGAIMLMYRGVTMEQFISGQFFLTPSGRGLGMKFVLVAWMILYQLVVGHKPAPRLIYVNMAAALVIVGISMLLLRAPHVFGPHGIGLP